MLCVQPGWPFSRASPFVPSLLRAPMLSFPVYPLFCIHLQAVAGSSPTPACSALELLHGFFPSCPPGTILWPHCSPMLGGGAAPRAADKDPTSGYLHPSVLESAGASPCTYCLLAKHQLEHQREQQYLLGLSLRGTGAARGDGTMNAPWQSCPAAGTDASCSV